MISQTGGSDLAVVLGVTGGIGGALLTFFLWFFYAYESISIGQVSGAAGAAFLTLLACGVTVMGVVTSSRWPWVSVILMLAAAVGMVTPLVLVTEDSRFLLLAVPAGLVVLAAVRSAQAAAGNRPSRLFIPALSSIAAGIVPLGG